MNLHDTYDRTIRMHCSACNTQLAEFSSHREVRDFIEVDGYLHRAKIEAGCTCTDKTDPRVTVRFNTLGTTIRYELPNPNKETNARYSNT